MKSDNRPEVDMLDILANAKPLVVLIPSAGSSHETAKRVAGLMPNVADQNDFAQKADELAAQLAVSKSA